MAVQQIALFQYIEDAGAAEIPKDAGFSVGYPSMQLIKLLFSPSSGPPSRVISIIELSYGAGPI
jgi:hypothetical protein